MSPQVEAVFRPVLCAEATRRRRDKCQKAPEIGWSFASLKDFLHQMHQYIRWCASRASETSPMPQFPGMATILQSPNGKTPTHEGRR